MGASGLAEADLLMPLCAPYTQNLYSRTKPAAHGGKALSIAVSDERILRDVKRLVALRAEAPKLKKQARL